jgi:hypothetical protein
MRRSNPASRSEEAEFCLEVAERVGLGFTLSSEKAVETGDPAPIAPKTTLKESAA